MTARIFVAEGENHFSMSRGSFKYKQSIKHKRQLKVVGKENTDTSGQIRFRDEISGEEYLYSLEKYERDGYRIRLESISGNTLVNRFWISFDTNPAEHYYGCGETYSTLDLKGEKVRIFVAEHQNANRIGKKLIKEKIRGKRPNKVLKFDKYESYYAQPTFVSSDKFFVHCDVSSYSEFDFRKKGEITLYFQEEPVLITRKAESFVELSEKLSELLGHQHKLPEWIYDGAILAIQEGPERIDEKLEVLQRRGVKVCGVWSQDWCGCRRTGFGYQVMWNWHQDKELYPDLSVKISEWKSKGIRFLGYINPFLAIEKDIYKEAAEKGYCVKDKDGKDYLVTITTFPAAMIDFTNPKAYEWYKNLIKTNMIGIGMSGWMADFGEYLPVDSVLFSGEDPAVIHNRWPAIWAKMNWEAIEECGCKDEVFFFTRAGHTGTISASSMMWTGDQHVDWSKDDGIGSVIPATLSLAMSGFGITHSDVGGYTTVMHMKRNAELLMRWEEMSAFSPLFRSHEGNQPVNDVQFDDSEELLAQLEKCVRWHTNLGWYLKNLVKECEMKGTPVMRPLFYHYDEDVLLSEKSEYLLGRDVLVAPVIEEGETMRKVLLPKDEWVHLFSEVCYGAGVHEVFAPIGEPPVFIRKNSQYYRELMAIKGGEYE